MSNDIFEVAKNIKNSASPPYSRSGTSTTGSELAEGSLHKLEKQDKQAAKKAINSKPGQVAMLDTARLNDGVYAPNKVKPASSAPADYYRRGRQSPPQGETETPTRYDYNPRFIQDPDEENVASIRLLGKPDSNSKSEPVDLIPPFSKFFLESYQEGHMERSQIIETFGDFYVFFFGERPPVYNFSGTLLNTKDINWKEDFMFYYDKFLRGTKCVEYQAKILLTYGLSQVEGFILSVNTQASAANDKGVQVSWQVLVTDRKKMRLSVDFGLIEDNGKFNEDRSIINMIQKGKSNPSTSDSYAHASKVVSKKSNAAKMSVPGIKELAKVKSIAPKTPLGYKDGSIGKA